MSGTVGICGTYKGVSRVQAVDRRKCASLGIVHESTSPRGRISTLNSYCKNHGRTCCVVAIQSAFQERNVTNRTYQFVYD
jgi:hypothetical protein